MPFKKTGVFFVLCLCLSFYSAHAEIPEKDFLIKPSPEWIELPPQFQSVVASYGKQGTLATFYIMARELEEAKAVQDLKWEDLFKPEFDSIHIHNQGETVIGGTKSRYCIYSLKPGAFKTAMEGKLPAKYMNYVLIRGNKLFSITFKDTQDGFALNYPSFVAAIRTFQFVEAPSAQKGGPPA